MHPLFTVNQSVSTCFMNSKKLDFLNIFVKLLIYHQILYSEEFLSQIILDVSILISSKNYSPLSIVSTPRVELLLCVKNPPRIQ